MESALSWRRLCLFLIAVVVLQSTFLYLSNSISLSRLPISPYRPEDLGQWRANTTSSDNSPAARKDGLTTEQCDEQFPNLYYQVDRAVAFWNYRGHTISEKDVNISWRHDAAFRILTHENELRILQTKGVHEGGYRVRMLSVLSQIQHALWSASSGGERLPTIEAAIIVDDKSLLGGKHREDTRSIWTFTSNVRDRNHQRHWLIPGFNLYSSPNLGSYGDLRRMAMQHDALISDKIPKVVWRGVKWTNEAIRGSLLEKTRNKTWADVAVMRWDTHENMLAMDENCHYAFTVYTEGRSYSGRLPFILNCDSVTLIHPLEWTTHFDHLLVPKGQDQNYVPVKRDFSDLEGTVKYYLDNPMEVQRIVQNSLRTFHNRYTTPVATSCYIRRLIAGYAEVSFTPEVTVHPSDDSVVRRRGISFEQFVHLLDENYDEKVVAGVE